MRVCVVGNGPSTLRHGSEIDACDLVIRFNDFKEDPRIGTKWDVWVTWFTDPALSERILHCGILDRLPVGLKIWIRDKPERYEKPVGFAKKMGDRLNISCCGRYPVRFFDPEWIREYFQGIEPTTGMSVIADVLENIKPDELIIVGFDAVSPDRKETWGDWWTGTFDKTAPMVHNYVIEKQILAEWIMTGAFCGRGFPETMPVWWRPT